MSRELNWLQMVWTSNICYIINLTLKGIPISVGDCCVSFDGDADRIVFFYVNKGEVSS